MFINYRFPSIAWDNKSYDVLRLVLAIEGSFVGSLLLMAQHRQASADRRIVYNDYVIDLQIRRQLKEIRPMIEEMQRRLRQDINTRPVAKSGNISQ